MSNENHSNPSIKEIENRILSLLEERAPLPPKRANSSEARVLVDQIIELHRLLSKEGEPPEGIKDFQTRFTELIAHECCLAELSIYLFDCLCYAQQSPYDGFEQACWMRSAAQLLYDICIDWDHPDSTAVREVYEEHIEEIDETFRNFAWEIPPILEEDFPDWVPESHWWWNVPIRKDMSPEERDRRINFAFYDAMGFLEEKKKRDKKDE